jgi:DNA polymerase III delta subunit
LDMLQVFFGNDTESVRQAAYAVIAERRQAIPASEVVRLEAETYEAGQFATLGDTMSLFGGVQLYLVDTPSESEVCFGELLGTAKRLAESTHHFVVIEGSLLAADKKMLTAAADKIEEFKAGSVEKFNAFKMADALVEKDKRRLWLLLQGAVAAGLPAEEIIGVLWWQLKTLRLAHMTKSASEAGVKDFPYNKAKRALQNFKAGELETLSHSLLTLYHDGHAGKRDINLALEAWVLRI